MLTKIMWLVRVLLCTYHIFASCATAMSHDTSYFSITDVAEAHLMHHPGQPLPQVLAAKNSSIAMEGHHAVYKHPLLRRYKQRTAVLHAAQTDVAPSTRKGHTSMASQIHRLRRMGTVSANSATITLSLTEKSMLIGIIGAAVMWIILWTIGWCYYSSHEREAHCGKMSCPPKEVSLSDIEHEPFAPVKPPTLSEIGFAVLVYAPWQLVVGIVFMSTFVAQQLLLLPFRICGGRPVTIVQRCFAPLMSSLAIVFVSTFSAEPCYGLNTSGWESINDFLQTCSASRRKNIRRNLRAAEQAMTKLGIEVSYCKAGSWRISAELRSLIWDQCRLHVSRALGSADIINCRQPIDPIIMYFGELVLMLAFPCDVQLLRTKSGRLVSLNTRVHVGTTIFNPNYATVQEYSQEGIYAWVCNDMVQEAIRLRADVLNLMPSMEHAKKTVGMQALEIYTAVLPCWSFQNKRPLAPGPSLLFDSQSSPRGSASPQSPCQAEHAFEPEHPSERQAEHASEPEHLPEPVSPGDKPFSPESKV